MQRIIRTAIIGLAWAVFSASHAAAHPGTGIVVDKRGNVFYTDLVHVWRIAPDGLKSIAVRDVHTHELALDSAGNLFGEDNRYQGGDRYRHRVWRRTPDGRVSDIIPWTDGFWRHYGFVRDGRGAMYWATCPARACTIWRRNGNEPAENFAPRARLAGNINWLAARPAGGLFFIDNGALRLIDADGTVSTVARNLGGSPMGMHVDSASNVYVAVYDARVIRRVTPGGVTSVVARTPAPWGPSGITIAPNGDMWILEYSTSNEARVRRVTRARGLTTPAHPA